MHANRGIETKADSLHGTSFFNGRKILKYFSDFYNWHLSIILQKLAQISKVK